MGDAGQGIDVTMAAAGSGEVSSSACGLQIDEQTSAMFSQMAAFSQARLNAAGSFLQGGDGSGSAVCAASSPPNTSPFSSSVPIAGVAALDPPGLTGSGVSVPLVLNSVYCQFCGFQQVLPPDGKCVACS